MTTSDVLAATMVYYTPYAHDLVPLYDGANWATAAFTERSIALDSDSGHTGYHQSGKNFDLFVVRDAGTLRLGTGPAWSSDTARGTGAGTTELERKNGIWANKVSMTLRYGSLTGDTVTVSANQGTYVGTMRATANGQCEDSLAKRLLWNVYNRVSRPMRVMETTASWTYTTATWRQMNADTANQLAFVRGLNEDNVGVAVHMFASTSGAGGRFVFAGIGQDSTTSPLSAIFKEVIDGSLVGVGNIGAGHALVPGLGYHFLAALEKSDAINVTTWEGAGDHGIYGSVFA